MAKKENVEYNPKNFGGEKEVNLMAKFKNQKDDARDYFINCIKPRLDRSYKLYLSDNSDRGQQIRNWQSNVSVPYIHGVVETLKPRILDARPDFNVKGRTQESQERAKKIQHLIDYTWEKANCPKTSELLVSSSLIYGTGFLQVSWKKDQRTRKFLKTKDIKKGKYTWKEKTETFYDAPYLEHVDNYSLWYDWHNIEEENKQYWFKRLILPESVIRRKYPMATKKRLEAAFSSGSGNLTDYASVRTELKRKHSGITKSDSNSATGSSGAPSGMMNGSEENIYENSKETLYEVFEWIRPHDDKYAVMVNDVPILKDAVIPIPYDFKEAPFIGVPYLRLQGEYEGYGLPMILENPQIMLNMIKNQRLDAMTLNIHKMWIVNPMANINKEELVARPFGIIYSTDPNGAREVSTSDINSSAYREEELLKSDMRYASGVDDYSMGSGGGAGSATEVRHLRESTLERVRLFIDHLGEAYSKVMRYWISMYKQFGSKKMTTRIVGDDGNFEFPLVEDGDLKGYYDFVANVIPSIAGQNDVKKKQDMDLFQLLMNMPFIDPEKLTQKLLYDWNWDITTIKKTEGQKQAEGQEGLEKEDLKEGASKEEQIEQMLQQQAQQQGGANQAGGQQEIKGKQIPPDVAKNVLQMLSGGQSRYNQQTPNSSPFQEASRPINLLKQQGLPPTPAGATTNPRGMNRGGKVNTNVPMNDTSDTESNLMNRANNIQS